MFDSCSSLTSITFPENFGSATTNMSYMFHGASKLSIIYVGSGWTMDNVTNDTSMYTNCGVSGVTQKS